MKTLLSAFLFQLLFFIPGCLNAQIQFVENKGQWVDDVKFKQDLSSGAFFLTSNGFTVLQHNTKDLKEFSAYFQGELPVKEFDDQKKITLHSHAYKVTFANALVPTISPDKILSNYNNYFIGNDPSKWAGNCKIYEAVTYKNIYPGIDVSYYTNNGQLKYDLIVHPGADVSNIQLKYEAVDALKIINEELVIKTSVADVKEMAPYAYEKGSNRQVECKFKIDGNKVKFETGSYNIQTTLVIDPTLVFSTLTGSIAENWGHAATYAPDGSAFAAGVVFDNGYPASPGAFQTVFQGGVTENSFAGYDIGIIRFSPNGSSRMYATYIGGSNNESPMSLISDAAGNLIVAARTASANYPTTSAIFGTGGGYDIAITKLNAAGNGLIGSRKIGGFFSDGVNIRLNNAAPQGPDGIRRAWGDDSRSMVILDTAENIVVVSQTMSTGFPTTPGAFQTFFAGPGSQDGVIIKTSPDVSTILFSSFFGGSARDAIFDVAISPVTNNLYIAGSTESINIPGNRTGVFQPLLQGNTDGFVSIVNSNGSSLISTTYVGTAGFDMLYNIEMDTLGFPYLTGTTTGSWPVINAPFVQPNSGQFICKLMPDLSQFVYSTVFGTGGFAPNIAATAFFVDACENVYVSGWGGGLNVTTGYMTNGTNGLFTTPGAIQTTTDDKDFYVFVLEKNAASVLYATFFGASGGLGDHIDGGTSSFDKNAVLYQAACHCDPAGSLFPTTPNSWSSTVGSSDCNQGLFKIAFDFCSIVVPLHIIYFKGNVLNAFHKLQWQIANEETGDRYIIEKRTDMNEPFVNVYTTASTSASISRTYYAQLPGGNAPETYYRLKTISLSGSVSYSPVIRLSGKPGNSISVQVIQNKLNVYMPGEVEGIALYTIDGKLLKQQKATESFVSIPLDNIAHGILVLKVQLKGETIVKKIYY